MYTLRKTNCGKTKKIILVESVCGKSESKIGEECLIQTEWGKIIKEDEDLQGL